jgi:hypothetical protein
MRFTRGQNGYESIFLDIDHIPITEDYEIVCGWDSGKTFSTENDRKFSLQKIQPGNVFTIFNTGVDGRCGIEIIPFKGNGILYKGHGRPFSNLVNPTDKAKRGDFVTLASLDARLTKDECRMWQVVNCRGFWEKS